VLCQAAFLLHTELLCLKTLIRRNHPKVTLKNHYF
jgi:hypothetical protein